MAEVIKHACIKDAPMFRILEQHTLAQLRKDKALLGRLIRRNALLKTKVVQADEFEQGERKLLNFGHTLGHAIENMYELPHGHAVSIGMVAAGMISEEFAGFTDTGRIISALKKYGLPTQTDFDVKRVMNVLKMDKKKVKDTMNYVLLEKIGKGVVRSIPIVQLDKLLQSIITAR